MSKVIEGNVDLKMRSLYELPDLSDVSVEGYFDCSRNFLTSLKGCPEYVGGDFTCFSNNLTSLEGGPKEVDGNYYCSQNKLTTLEGAPKKVGWNFSCESNPLTSLEGCPKEVGGYFDIKAAGYITEAQVRAVCKVRGKVFTTIKLVQ